MKMLRKSLFISDLHLDENCPKIIHHFLHFLASINPRSIDSLYILGDLFEAWIGDDYEASFVPQIKEAFRELQKKNIGIFFIHGNRDFLVGSQFCAQTSIQILDEVTVIDLYNKPILLLHGDILCTNDSAYIKTRKYFHHPLFQKIFLALPLFLRKKIASYLRKQSTVHTQTISDEMMDVNEQTVLEILANNSAKLIIHGHTHKPAIHRDEQGQFERIVLGAWHDEGNFLIYREDAKKRLVNFTIQTDLVELIDNF